MYRAVALLLAASALSGCQVSLASGGLDYDKLAQLRITGGNIRTIAINAAFLAAETKEPVRMSHVREATRMEYAKLERNLTSGEISSTV